MRLDRQSHKKPQPAVLTAPAEDLSVIIREARLRFMEAFNGHCEAIAPANPQAATVSAEEACRLLHRMAGLGGTLGFPRVSAKATEMETVLVDRQLKPAHLRDDVAE